MVIKIFKMFIGMKLLCIIFMEINYRIIFMVLNLRCKKKILWVIILVC